MGEDLFETGYEAGQKSVWRAVVNLALNELVSGERDTEQKLAQMERQLADIARILRDYWPELTDEPFFDLEEVYLPDVFERFCKYAADD